MGDGLEIISRKHSRLEVRNCSMWATTPRKVRVISPPWIVVREEKSFLGL